MSAVSLIPPFRWEQNQRRSPLLRLPPELRNRIYELVLDVGQVNVGFKRWEHRLRTPHGRRAFDTIEGGFCCRVLGRDENPWRPSKPPVPGDPAPSRGMTLLSPVCRRLYHETTLLPYTLNAWSFASRHVMERYVMKEKRLPLPQRRAIHTLYSQHVLPWAVEKYLGGLKVIVLENGLKMTKRFIEADLEHGQRPTISWDLSHQKWK